MSSLFTIAYEQATSQSVPRRGTIHDLGRSVTHKAVICYKRLVEKKSTSEVAQETYLPRGRRILRAMLPPCATVQ